MPLDVPDLDLALRGRMVARYGAAEVEPWLDSLPPVLLRLARRWHLELGVLIPHGHMSVVIRCRTAVGAGGVLKICYDRERLATEAAALREWHTSHVPSVLACDTDIGALLIEAIVPGTMFSETNRFDVPAVAELVNTLHTAGTPDPSWPPLDQRVAYIFDAWASHRRRQPELMQVVSQDLFDEGRRLASALSVERSQVSLLHGDLTAVNILDGGDRRGLVAIDPAPCVGDPAYDAIDLVLGPGLEAGFWRADDVDRIIARAAALARAMDVDASRLIAWCAAFAGMTASELASASNNSDARIRTLLRLATTRAS